MNGSQWGNNFRAQRGARVRFLSPPPPTGPGPAASVEDGSGAGFETLPYSGQYHQRPVAEADGSTSPVEQRADSCRLRILVATRTGTSQVVGIHDGRIKIQVAAAPVDNAANDAVVRLLASNLGVKRTDVDIISGQKSRRKTVEVGGITQKAAHLALGL